MLCYVMFVYIICIGILSVEVHSITGLEPWSAIPSWVHRPSTFQVAREVSWDTSWFVSGCS